MKLTPHFTLEEMIASPKATALHINNTPTFDDTQHLHELCAVLLEPLRNEWGSAIRVSSGYRSAALNAAVKGSKTSAHNTGYAADIVPVQGNIRSFKRFVKTWLRDSGLPFDQCIDERNQKGDEWIHIAIRRNDGSQRRQFLITRDTITYKIDKV